MFIWTFHDIIEISIISIICIIFFIIYTNKLINQFLCKHEKVRENMACDAICVKCDKNLGFIGTWRKRNPDKEEI